MAQARSSSVLSERLGNVLLITINRPEVKNALNVEVLEKLKNLWDDFDDDKELKVAVLTGAGGDAFSSGADLKEIAGGKGRKRPPGIHRGMNVGKPVIAAVNGIAFGGGFETALACDIRVAARNATFAMREVRLGFMPGGGGTVRLARTAHPGRALYLLLTGKEIGAEEAHRAGIVDFISDEGKAVDEALKLAREIAQNETTSLISIKESFYHSFDNTLMDALQYESQRSRALAESAAFRKKVEKYKK
ncbi:MAG: enoyl-CoA hydratase/isomerase family protein [bacterium]